jgi:UDP-3-O-[3-hydroxymyristoyl] glucosamine N-acyltransferase
MHEELYLIGGGSYAQKILDCLNLLEIEPKAIIVQDYRSKNTFGAKLILNDKEFSNSIYSGRLFIAVGNPDIRAKLMAAYLPPEWEIMTIIHPRAFVSPEAIIEEGVFVAANAVIEAGCKVGRGSIIDIGVLLDHDCMIKPYSHIQSKCAYSRADFA